MWSCLSFFNKAYKNLHYEKSGILDGKEKNVESWLKEYQVDDMRRYKFLKKRVFNKKVIDFGCSAPGFLKIISKSAKDVDDIELEQAMQESFIKRKLKVFTDYKFAIRSKKNGTY